MSLGVKNFSIISSRQERVEVTDIGMIFENKKTSLILIKRNAQTFLSTYLA